MPDLVGVLGQRDAFHFAVASIEQAEFHPRGVPRVQREVHTQSVPGRPSGTAGSRTREVCVHLRLAISALLPARGGNLGFHQPLGHVPVPLLLVVRAPFCLPDLVGKCLNPLPSFPAVHPYLSLVDPYRQRAPARSPATSAVALKCSMRPSRTLRMGLPAAHAASRRCRRRAECAGWAPAWWWANFAVRPPAAPAPDACA